MLGQLVVLGVSEAVGNIIRRDGFLPAIKEKDCYASYSKEGRATA